MIGSAKRTANRRKACATIIRDILPIPKEGGPRWIDHMMRHERVGEGEGEHDDENVIKEKTFMVDLGSWEDWGGTS
jgi:ferredoxin